MNHPEEAPKLPKFPFIAGDLVLIATALFIANRSDGPLGTTALIAITACVLVGAALATIPFLADYARRSDAELTERQNQIAALARTTSDSAEQLSIVASGLNGISESSKHNLAALDKLPSQLKERIDGVTQQLAGSALAVHSSVKEDVARLEAASENLSRTLARIETAAKAKADALAAGESALAATLARAAAQLDAFLATATTAATRLAELPTPAPIPVPVAPQPAPEPVFPTVEPVAPAETIAVVTPEPAPEAVAAAAPMVVVHEPEPPAFTPYEPDPAEVPVSEPAAPKPPRARKPKPLDDTPDLGLTAEVPDSAESSITSDGFTRLIATAYIGIGNKLYIRGDGPGLSWDKGVPLQFVSIGKWRWESADATATVKAKLYKNDQVECQGLGTLTLEPGRQHEVNAGF